MPDCGEKVVVSGEELNRRSSVEWQVDGSYENADRRSGVVDE